MVKKFYMCCVGPINTYPTIEIAMKKAERLAKENPKRRVFILQAVSYCEAQATPIWWTGL